MLLNFKVNFRQTNILNLTKIYQLISYPKQKNIINKYQNSTQINYQHFLLNHSIPKYFFSNDNDQKKNNQQIPSVQDFAKIDLRIGQILKCQYHPQSVNLYCSKINVCQEIREIGSGLQKYIPIQQMKGKILVMVNLKPRKLAGIISNGMIVCVTSADQSKVQLIVPNGEVNERIYLEGNEQLFKLQQSFNKGQSPINQEFKEKQKSMNKFVNKKILQKCLQFLKTNEEGYVNWKGIKLRTKNGYLKTTISNGSVS